MRAMRNRPVLLQRFPNGSTGSSFFQKRMPDNAPDWLSTTIVSTPNGTTSNALVIDDLAHLVWAVNLGCLGFHSWPMRAADPEHCDELRIDLDPGPGTTFAMAQETAHETRRLFDELGIRSYIKTTGNRGLHVYVRLAPEWDSVAVRSRRRRGRPRAGASASRTRHRVVVEGRTRRADLRRLQPERTAQDGVRAVVGAGPRPRAGLVRFRMGRTRLDQARSADDRRRCRSGSAHTATRGPTWTTIRSRSSRCSNWFAATRRTDCSMHPGRRCIRRWRANPRASLPVGRRSRSRSRTPGPSQRESDGPENDSRPRRVGAGVTLRGHDSCRRRAATRHPLSG